jgi:glycosyltransferase involved in cell wall biosynthesis
MQVIDVAIITFAEKRKGGVLSYSRSMIEAMKLVPSGSARLTIFTSKKNREYDDLEIPICRLPSTAVVLLKRLFGVDPFLNMDVVIAPTYSLALLATKRPFAFTLHDMQERHYPEYFSRPNRAWRLFKTNVLARSAARIICESRFVRDDIVRFLRVPAQRVEIIVAPPVSKMRRSMVEVSQIEAVRARFGLPECYVLYPAQFWLHKNHRRLVSAFAEVIATVPQCHLVLTGAERDEFPNVMSHVRDLGLADIVHHIGYVALEDLAALYAGASVVAVPTLFESLSIPVYEAFLMEVPVCASAVVALPEQVGDAGLLFDPKSPTDIAEKIVSLLVNEDLRRKLVVRGKQRMAAIRMDLYSAKLWSLISQLVESGRVSREGSDSVGCK